MNRYFSNEDIRWPIGTWKDVHHHLLSGKCKLKLPWDITLHLSEWLKSETQETTGVGDNVEKGEPFCSVYGNANWCCHSEKLWRFLKKLKIELPYDPAITLLGIYPKNTKTVIQRDTCTLLFITALFNSQDMEAT